MTMTKPTSEQVTFTAAGSGATLRNLVDKVRESVSAADFGAVGDGVANDTAALKAAFDYAMPLKRPVVLRGTYLVNGPVTSLITRAVGELHIICDGNVVINVDPATVSSFALFYLVVNPASSNASITGGSLTIDCANRLPNCFYIYHLNTTTSGTISITCPVTVVNCKQNGSSGDAMALAIFGKWQRIDINDFTAIGVSRTVSAGVCRGINAQIGETGECTIRRPYCKNILLPNTTDQNCDGIGVQGWPAAGNFFDDNRLGRIMIEDATFVDCQGRAVKSQCSDTTVVRPKVFRQFHQSPAGFDEFAFQYAGGRLLSPTFDYRDNGGTSPLGADFTLVSFWFNTKQFETYNCMKDAAILADVSFREMCRIVPETYMTSGSVEIDGVRIIPINGYSGAIATRGLAELRNVADFDASGASLSIAVRNVDGPMSGPGFLYSAYTGAAGGLASRLSVEVTNVQSTIAPGTLSDCIYQIDGNNLGNLDSFVFRDNVNLRSWIASTGQTLRSFEFSKLRIGTSFCVNLTYLNTALIPDAPPWDASGGDSLALIEVLGAGLSSINLSKMIRVTTFAGTNGTRNRVFFSFDNAVTWRQLDANAPRVATANITVNNAEDVIINNKSGSTCVMTLPAAASWPGRRLLIKTIQAQAVDSASSNVVPLAGGAAGTSILTNTAGKYADLVSDGTNWIIMAAN